MYPVYVTGHKNPDTDSIVSAIAYTALRHALGEREYVAARLGNVSDETRKVLDLFDAEEPMLLNNVRTQVRDLNYDTPPVLQRSVTIKMAWEKLHETEAGVAIMPIVDENDHLYGMLSSGDIANFAMRTISDPNLYEVPTYNLLSVLEGQIINKVRNLPETLTGQVTLAVPQAREDLVFQNEDAIVICGHQPDMIHHAVDVGAKIVIVCQADFSDEFRNLESETCIVTTPFDAYKAARLIHMAVPVERVCTTKDLHYFHLDDYIDDVRDVLLKSRYRGYPILDENEHVVGTLGRYHLIRPNRKKVVLVDHNEQSQSVPGLNQAELIGIIDHHRLADIQSSAPIFFRNEPVGSSATIIAGMYQEKGLMPSQKIAGLLAAAIISDTVMFKSPTCTEQDKIIAERMAHIAHVTLEDIGNTIFSSGISDDKPIDRVIFTDFKEFLLADHTLGIGQVTCLNSDKVMERKEEMLAAMQKKKEEKGYDYILVMLTDVLKEGTMLLYIGDDDTISNAYGVEAKNNEVFLPHVMSRKKQIVPRLSELWG